MQPNRLNTTLQIDKYNIPNNIMMIINRLVGVHIGYTCIVLLQLLVITKNAFNIFRLTVYKT